MKGEKEMGITVATSIIAGLVMIITLGQFLNNRMRLKHDLFDRRYDIFEKVAAFISKIMLSGDVSNQEMNRFLKETKRAYFVFGCDNQIKDSIQKIHKNASELHALQSTRDSDSQAILDRKRWFADTAIRLESSKFARYLKLGINIRNIKIKKI
jgi:hypothetical protein